MTETIRIAVVDDHPLMLEGVVHIVSQEDDFDVVGRGTCADEAVGIAKDKLPDIMLIDMNMPGSGLAAMARISESCPAVRMIALTVREDHAAVGKAFAAGARGYVLKGVSSDALLAIIRAVHEGGSYVSPELANKLADDHGRGQRVAGVNAVLTEREEQILRLIGRGLSNKEIGRELDLKEKTIKHYVTNVLQKLHVRNRVEAALVSKERGES